MLEDFNQNLNRPISSMTLAGAGSRLAAALLDGLIVSLVGGILGALALFLFSGGPFFSDNDDYLAASSPVSESIMAGGVMALLAVSLCISWGYYAYFESSEKQATIGKQAMKIKVVSDSGQRITFLNALGRIAGKALSGMICYIGYLMILFRSDEKGLHDLLANTYVVKA